MGIQSATGPSGRGRPTSPVWDPFGTRVANKDESRLPTNAGESEFLAAFYPDGTPNPAAAAIEQAAPGAPPMPRIRPIPPASIPLTAAAPPAVPSSLGPITFRKGDTVWDLARDRGMTVKSFADLYGIKNPDRIRAGDTVIPKVPAPRSPPPSMRRPSSSRPNVLDEVGAFRYHG